MYHPNYDANFYAKLRNLIVSLVNDAGTSVTPSGSQWRPSKRDVLAVKTGYDIISNGKQLNEF